MLTKREPLIIANWKMNVLPNEAVSLVLEICKQVSEQAKIIVAPPFTHLSLLGSLNNDNIFLGAQDCHEKDFGAFTSEISCPMLKDLGVKYIILGHSEKRLSNPLENNRITNKIKSVLQAGLKAVYCCGEPLDIRESGKHLEFIKIQLQNDLPTNSFPNIENLIIAYEPIWAIGTGKTALNDQILETHEYIYDWLSDNYGKKLADTIPILYGGSVNSNNAAQIAHIPNVNGALVGGASLNPLEFANILNSFYLVN
ncbi:MAG: triose-phosphate isomerase [Saprospiraceae bacterium]|nr:triose-phosphate isomerase [Saprospiraceae bacterium]MBK7812378.1 triose-phosphate isomerase [Saprospiraceae bacterium]